MTPARRHSRVRCYTRALKNARHLKETAPEQFDRGTDAQGFGTGVPLGVLRTIHRLAPDSLALRRHPEVAEYLRNHHVPPPGAHVGDPLFSGTVHFALVTYRTKRGDRSLPADDMRHVISYAARAIRPISEYAASYGPHRVTIAPRHLSYTAEVPTGRFTDAELQRWVDDMATTNDLPADSCIVVVCPSGIRAENVEANAGYHSKSPSIPYVVAGVDATGLTLDDAADVYAMVVSHEMAEMVVDPNVDNRNPEVCDPCDLNCNNLTRSYFDAAHHYLGSNQLSPPGGFPYDFYTCAVVKPAGAAGCPAPAADCAYGPHN